MESIIIFVLFAIGSVIFQVIKESGNQQKQPAPAPKAGNVKMQPAVPPHKSPGNQDTASISKKKKQQSPAPRSVFAEGSQASMEGVQTEALRDSGVSNLPGESVVSSGTSILQDIAMDELQRSIIMAEVLGKPKALRRNSR